MSKYKVGDRVRGGYGYVTYTGTISKICADIVHVMRDDDGSLWECKVLENGSVGGANGMYDGHTKLELIKESPICLLGSLTTSKTNKTIMNTITEFAKNLTLSADEKSLRKVGLKTECGDYTAEAQSIVMQTLCKEREAMLVEIANKKIDEDKK